MMCRLKSSGRLEARKIALTEKEWLLEMSRIYRLLQPDIQDFAYLDFSLEELAAVPWQNRRWGSDRGVYYWHDRRKEEVWRIGGSKQLARRIDRYRGFGTTQYVMPCEADVIRVGLIAIGPDDPDMVFWVLEETLISIMGQRNGAHFYQYKRAKWVARLGIDRLPDGSVQRFDRIP